MKIAELYLQARACNAQPRAAATPSRDSHPLQDDEPVDAELFLNRAAQYAGAVEDWTLSMRYQVCGAARVSSRLHSSLPAIPWPPSQVSTARVLDSKRKFLEAAKKFHSLSQPQQVRWLAEAEGEGPLVLPCLLRVADRPARPCCVRLSAWSHRKLTRQT